MTKLCDQYNKQFKHQKENKDYQIFIYELSSVVGIPADDFLILIKGGFNTELRGTYVH